MPSDRDSKSVRSSLNRSLKEAGPYLTLGLELGFTMIAWSVIGYLLDRWLGTLPWLTMAGVVVGMVSLFLQVVRASRRSQERSNRKMKRGDHDAMDEERP